MANNDNSCENLLQLFDDGPTPVLAVFLFNIIWQNIDISINIIVLVSDINVCPSYLYLSFANNHVVKLIQYIWSECAIRRKEERQDSHCWSRILSTETFCSQNRWLKSIKVFCIVSGAQVSSGLLALGHLHQLLLASFTSRVFLASKGQSAAVAAQ